MWMSWGERFLALFAFIFLPSEQVGSFVVWILLLLNGLSFFALSRKLNWPASLGLALSICWAFNAFTHARAKVHLAMSGLYHLPLIFLGLHLVRESLTSSKNQKLKIILASFCFLFSAMTLHYFIILTAAMSPFLLLYYFSLQETRSQWKKALLHLSLSAVPCFLFLAWCFTHPLPEQYLNRQAQSLPQTGEYKNERGIHPFLEQFAAKPIDYFAGDTGLGEKDWNPLRSMLTLSIYKNLDGSNAHERANSIRWWLWFCFALSLWWILRKDSILPKEQKRLQLSLLLLGVFAFILSLSPVYFDKAWGPSAWIHSLVSQFRVPNRAGVFVHFSILLIVGSSLSYWFKHGADSKRKSFLKRPWVLPLVALISFPPLLNPMPLSKIQAPYTSLTENQELKCGSGMYFPYVSATYSLLEFYYFVQRLRGTHCSIINRADTDESNTAMLKAMPLHPEILKAINERNPQLTEGIKRFTECTGIQWIAFDSRVGPEARSSLCQSLNWQMTEPDVCQAQRPHMNLQRLPANCLNN